MRPDPVRELRDIQDCLRNPGGITPEDQQDLVNRIDVLLEGAPDPAPPEEAPPPPASQD